MASSAQQECAGGGIQVRGASVFGGYWRMPEKTAQEFTQDGWFRTSDVGQVDAREQAETDRLVAVYTAMRPREAARVFATMSRAGISVVLITQSSSEYSISFCVPQWDCLRARRALE